MIQYFASFHDLFVTGQTNQTGQGNTEGQKKVLLIWNCHFQRTRQKKNLAPREFLASCLSPLICKGRVLSLQLLLCWRLCWCCQCWRWHCCCCCCCLCWKGCTWNRKVVLEPHWPWREGLDIRIHLLLHFCFVVVSCFWSTWRTCTGTLLSWNCLLQRQLWEHKG